MEVWEHNLVKPAEWEMTYPPMVVGCVGSELRVLGGGAAGVAG